MGHISGPFSVTQSRVVGKLLLCQPRAHSFSRSRFRYRLLGVTYLISVSVFLPFSTCLRQWLRLALMCVLCGGVFKAPSGLSSKLWLLILRRIKVRHWPTGMWACVFLSSILFMLSSVVYYVHFASLSFLYFPQIVACLTVFACTLLFPKFASVHSPCSLIFLFWFHSSNGLFLLVMLSSNGLTF